MDKTYFQQLGTGVASLTFGAALAIFIYAANLQLLLNNIQALLLYVTSFLLMLRFWWRYTELFVRFLPSRSFWQFLFDFAISFFGILTVLHVNAIQTWASLGACAMLASMVRCALSWRDAGNKDIKSYLRRTFAGSVAMLIVMSAVYALAPVFSALYLAEAVFVLVLVFVVVSSRNIVKK